MIMLWVMDTLEAEGRLHKRRVHAQTLKALQGRGLVYVKGHHVYPVRRTKMATTLSATMTKALQVMNKAGGIDKDSIHHKTLEGLKTRGFVVETKKEIKLSKAGKKALNGKAG